MLSIIESSLPFSHIIHKITNQFLNVELLFFYVYIYFLLTIFFRYIWCKTKLNSHERDVVHYVTLKYNIKLFLQFFKF
jgi:preprotein translocase subunit SecY